MNAVVGAVRLKQVRDRTIVRGRAELSLFERAPDGQRPHPRLRMDFAKVSDPQPPKLPAIQTWANVQSFRRWLLAALDAPNLQAGLGNPPEHSPHYWSNAIVAGRITALLDHARAGIEAHPSWTAAEREAAHYAIAESGALAYAGTIQFDDEDSGTYHSYKYDQPFVHVFEQLLLSLPTAGSEAFALLPEQQQQAVQRQREQLRNHLNHLMRHKYAFLGITETDIERTLGGFLIDRDTRRIASETPASADALRPEHELLRIDPAAAHEHAGAWLMRTAEGLALYDGTLVELGDAALRRTPVASEQLSFARAPNHPLLRAGVRFDWNSDGWVDDQPIDWITWAGHCDVKAVLEAIGLALVDQDPVFEYRSDTGAQTELSRDLLLELLTGVVEFGSVYTRLDGSGRFVRGIHRFGGARNDSLPDRIQFRGLGVGRHFRWPITRKRDALRLLRIEQNGQALGLDTAFARCIPDRGAVDFHPNPRYLETVDGDYNLIDASGMVLTASVRVWSFDDRGQLVHRDRELELDLRPEAQGQSFLGTHVEDPSARELYRVHLDRAQPAVVAELWRWEPSIGEVHVPERDLVVPLVSPISATVSREMRRDDPEVFQALIELALHRGENICADTDMTAPVWNGVVTRMEVERTAVNPQARVERWRVHFTARYGQSELDYMVRRAADGRPQDYCPANTDDGVPPPDFLWQDLPDIASKGVEQGAWVVNATMQERGIVTVRRAPHEQGGWYVEDDHIKNAFELLFAALAGYRWTIVHQNKRYGFTDEAAWTAARRRLDALRSKLSFM